MDKSKFEQICQESKLSPAKRVDARGMVVLVADGWFQDHPEHRGPHYKTLWAIGNNEDQLLVAQPIYFGGSVGSTSKKDRVDLAVREGIRAVEVVTSGRS